MPGLSGIHTYKNTPGAWDFKQAVGGHASERPDSVFVRTTRTSSVIVSLHPPIHAFVFSCKNKFIYVQIHKYKCTILIIS